MEVLEQNERNFVRQTESLMREILVLQNFFKAMVTLTVKSPSGAVYYFVNDAESLLLVNKSGLLGEKSFFINPALTKFSSNEKLQDSCNEPTQEVPSRTLEKKSTTRNIKPPALYPHRGGVGSASNVQEFTFRRCLTEEDEYVHSEVMRSSFEASDVIHDTKAFVPLPVARANLVQLPVELENLFTFHDTSPFCFTADPPSTFCSPNPQRVDHVTQRSFADSGFINFKERFSFSELMRSPHIAANTSGGKCLSAKRDQNFSSISTLRMRPRDHEVDAESLHVSKTMKLDPKSSNKKNSRKKKSSSRLKKKLKKSQTKCVAPEKDTFLSREVLEVFDRVFSPNNLDTDAKFASHIAKHERREQGMDASNLLTQYSGLAGLNKKLVSAFPNKKVRRIFVYKALENSKFLLVVETQVGLALKRRQMQGKGHFTAPGGPITGSRKCTGIHQKLQQWFHLSTQHQWLDWLISAGGLFVTHFLKRIWLTIEICPIICQTWKKEIVRFL
ncbi:uncharacterized protein LOC143459021 isoform X2 [Clavelina lepadiformis]|uniref:uncharacterized protein LOC143459021 isoform X2 n=1 Tax=Clavelina lepadiformis TaxID=159417 RepID=UPI0040412DD5